jgi:TonB family protein
VPPPPAPVVPPVEAKLDTDAPQLDLQAPQASIPDIHQRISRKFTPPPAPVKAKLADVTPPPEAPQLAVSLNQKPVELPLTTKAPGRTFVAPPARTAPAPKQVAVDLPPSVSTAQPSSANTLLADARDLNLAIVGLKPAEKQTALPTTSSPGQFSAAPAIRPEGADAAAGETKGIAVPDLFVRGAPGAKPDMMAEAFAAPTSSSTLRQALRTAPPRITNPANDEASAPGAPPAAANHPSAAIKVSGAPDPRFNGREVFMMAIQMPNLTSYSGSWLMWYSDRTAHEAGLAPIAPPVAYRIVDPKYIASAVSERVEGKIRLACVIDRSGRVAGVELVHGIDDRLNQSAEEALSKWEFTPATRKGEPVEVDVLVEIPFHLEPHKPVSF